MRRIIAIAALLVLSLAGCTPSQPAVPTQGPQEPTRAVSPLPTATAPSSPLATPASPLASVTPAAAVIVTPSPDRATITGVLMTNPDAPKPVAGAVVALAEIILGPSGTPTAGSFDRSTSPRTQTDRAGRFVFPNVKVQKYGLVLDRITASYMLQDPSGKGDMVWDPKPGQVLDVGKLIYRSLPEGGALP